MCIWILFGKWVLLVEHSLEMNTFDRQHHDRFLRLFLEHEPSLRVFVRSLLFTHEEAREVMQEVAAVLWRKFDAGLDDKAFRRWAFGVARMEVLAFRRDRARDRHMFGEEVVELLAQTVQEQDGTLEAERRVLDLCLQKLPAGQRRLVEAAYAPGARIDQMAGQLGRTAMALYKALHRIRLALMDCMRRAMTTEGLA